MKNERCRRNTHYASRKSSAVLAVTNVAGLTNLLEMLMQPPKRTEVETCTKSEKSGHTNIATAANHSGNTRENSSHRRQSNLIYGLIIIPTC